MTDSILGLGLYSFADAARYVGTPARELRRWLLGYAFSSRGERRESPPIWHPKPQQFEIDGVAFHDLIELRFVSAFRRHGVSLRAIRQASQNAREMLKSAYPFSCRKFQTDGRSIFGRVLEETGDESVVDMVRRQHVFDQVVGPSLYAGIEFGPQGAARWFPVRQSSAIVLDPQRSFGQPLLTESGIPTVAIAEALKAERGDDDRVARYFRISRELVRRAAAFEQRLAAA